MDYCCQSTAAATEASPGAFGGLFGCSQHTKSKAGRKNIFFVKKRAYGGTTVDPHMPIFFYEKIFFRPSWIFRRQEQPKRPPNPPGLASIAAAVLWQRYFNCHNRRPPYVHFFKKKSSFRPSLIFHRQEQPKSRPKPPGFASIAAAVPWRQYFNCPSCGRLGRN